MLELTAIADVCKSVELARALASEPKLLLLEEPPAGLNHADLAELGRLIIKRRAWPDVSLRLGVGRCNWSGGRNDGGADDLSRPRYDERGIQEINDQTNNSSLVNFQAPLHQCVKAIL
jgi:hypothetical protein